MASVFEEWTCAFPGKMGLSWKRAWDGVGSKSEAEDVASKNCNVVALPVQLYKHIKDMEARVVHAERKLQELHIRVDYDNNMMPTFVDLRPKNGPVA